MLEELRGPGDCGGPAGIDQKLSRQTGGPFGGGDDIVQRHLRGMPG